LHQWFFFVWVCLKITSACVFHIHSIPNPVVILILHMCASYFVCLPHD
jgi:hypothetical protein